METEDEEERRDSRDLGQRSQKGVGLISKLLGRR